MTDLDLRAYDFFKKLVALPYVEAIYLSGSRARGEHDDNSDLDLAISCPLASGDEWNAIMQITRTQEEILLRVDAVRLDKITSPEHRNFVIHKRRLLYLRDYGGDNAMLIGQMDFFEVWQKKLHGWIAKMESGLVMINYDNEQRLLETLQAFRASFDCIWVLLRKALSTCGMRVNTPLATFREAYMEGWLPHRHIWERMMEDYRNLDDKKTPAQAVQSLAPRLPEYIAAMREAGQAVINVMQPYLYLHA